MNISDLFPSENQLKIVQGVERTLLNRNRKGTIGGLVAICGAVIQILDAAVRQKNLLKTVGQFVENIVQFKFQVLVNNPDNIGMIVLSVGFGTYFFCKRTHFLMKESEEPFRYTFWVEPFKQIEGTPGLRFCLKKDDRFYLLDHDLIERLNNRIRRLSMLDVTSLKTAPVDEKNLTSHIHVSGYYTLREEEDGRWIIQVTPRIRIGPTGRPETLAQSVKYTLLSSNPAATEFELLASHYNQVVEQLYSRIASEVYKQIKSDVKEKITLFPTNYLRAAALFHEADDFERSNTIDAYDYAIELYQESKRYFDMRYFKRLSESLLYEPLLWRFTAMAQIMESRARTGYSRCLIFRRVVSAVSGRFQNPLYAIPAELEIALKKLTALHNRINRKWQIQQTYGGQVSGHGHENNDEVNQYRTFMAFLNFPKDSLIRRIRPVFDKERAALFETYLVAALAYSNLGFGANRIAGSFLISAKSADPVLSQERALWLLAAAEIEPDINQKLLLLRQSTDSDPNFEIARFRLAFYSDVILRRRNEISKENRLRVESVINEYGEVLRINPGNIGSMAAQGYLWWLLDDLPAAEKIFREGREIKTFISQAFIGDLHYGLARIAAENGRFAESLDYYTQAIASEPGVGAYSITASKRMTSQYYEYVSPGMLQRYEEFRTRVEQAIERYLHEAENIDPAKRAVSGKMINAVHCFVLNDYGNACLNHFHRYGDCTHLEAAIKAYENAIGLNSENVVVYYNIANAFDWHGKTYEKIADMLTRAEKLAPAWPVVLVATVQALARVIPQSIDSKKQKLDLKTAELERKRVELQSKKERTSERQQLTESMRKPVPVDKEDFKTGKIMRDIKGLEVKIKEMEEEVAALPKKCEKELFPKINKIMDQTKFIALFKGLCIDFQGTGVTELCRSERSINKDLLDENDIESLRVWAEILSYNIEANKDALEASRKLCTFISKYNPENLEIHSILYGLNTMIMPESDNTDEQKKILENLRMILQNWLRQDPLQFTTLWWAQQYFEKLDGLLDDIEPETDKERYYYLLGNFHAFSNLPNKNLNYDLAARYYGNAIEYNRDFAEYHAKQGFAFMKAQKWEEAERSYLKALELDSDKADYLNDLGNVYYTKEDYGMALDFYNKAVLKFQNKAVYHANLAHTYDKLGRQAEAVDEYKKVFVIEPGNEQYKRELKLALNDEGIVYFNNADYPLAIGRYKEALELDPADYVIHANLALAYSFCSQWNEALTSYNNALAIDPDNAEYLNSLGNNYFSQADYDLAAAYYRRASEQKEDNMAYPANLIRALNSAGKETEGEEVFEHALELADDDAAALNDLGNAFYKNMDYYKARESFRKAVDFMPDKALYQANLGAALRGTGELETAEQAYLTAIKLDPGNLNYLNDLGNVYFSSSNYEQARSYYQKAAVQAPNVSVYHANSGDALTAMGELDEAKKAYESALSLEPANDDYLNCLGNAYYKGGEYRPAAEKFLEALRINPAAQVYTANIVSACQELMDDDAAKTILEAALEVNHDNSVLLDAIESLKK